MQLYCQLFVLLLEQSAVKGVDMTLLTVYNLPELEIDLVKQATCIKQRSIHMRSVGQYPTSFVRADD